MSTREQHLDSQLDALHAAGCERVSVDKVSGKRFRRSQWDSCRDYLSPGDELVITRLSRVARMVRHMTRVTAELEERGIELVVLAPGHRHHVRRTQRGRVSSAASNPE